MFNETSARPSGARREVPAKITSSILPPRRLLAPCSPMTQARASATLDLPEPFGPTMQVMPGSSRSEVTDANDLKPLRVRLLRYTSDGLLWGGDEQPHCTGEGRETPGGEASLSCSLCSVLAVLSRRVDGSPRYRRTRRRAADHCHVAGLRSCTRGRAPASSVEHSPPRDDHSETPVDPVALWPYQLRGDPSHVRRANGHQ